VRQVTALLDTWPTAVTHIFDTMAELVRLGRIALGTADWQGLGQLMDMQHGLAHAIGVDTAETVELVFRAREAGAYGAKLSGAGGGDCIIVLAPGHKRTDIENTLRRSGGQIVPVLPNAPGVRIETEDQTS
jgi:mevalonate kinase